MLSIENVSKPEVVVRPVPSVPFESSLMPKFVPPPFVHVLAAHDSVSEEAPCVITTEPEPFAFMVKETTRSVPSYWNVVDFVATDVVPSETVSELLLVAWSDRCTEITMPLLLKFAYEETSEEPKTMKFCKRKPVPEYLNSVTVADVLFQEETVWYAMRAPFVVADARLLWIFSPVSDASALVFAVQLLYPFMVVPSAPVNVSRKRFAILCVNVIYPYYQSLSWGCLNGIYIKCDYRICGDCGIGNDRRRCGSFRRFLG